MRYRSDWISKDARDNATALRRHYREGFTAIAELDRLGHSLLHAAGSPHEPAVLEQIVGIALLRRAVSTFSSVRALLESALPDPARAPARALFEIWLNYRCLAYGAESDIALETRTERTSREPRAHRFFVASERRGLRSRAMVLLPDIAFVRRPLSNVTPLKRNSPLSSTAFESTFRRSGGTSATVLRTLRSLRRE
jgi:hypothetical protein